MAPGASCSRLIASFPELDIGVDQQSSCRPARNVAAPRTPWQHSAQPRHRVAPPRSPRDARRRTRARSGQDVGVACWKPSARLSRTARTVPGDQSVRWAIKPLWNSDSCLQMRHHCHHLRSADRRLPAPATPRSPCRSQPKLDLMNNIHPQIQSTEIRPWTHPGAQAIRSLHNSSSRSAAGVRTRPGSMPATACPADRTTRALVAAHQGPRLVNRHVCPSGVFPRRCEGVLLPAA